MGKDSPVTTYVWPMETVTKVSGLRTSVLVDALTLERYGDDAMGAVKDQLSRALQRLAEPLAAVPHPDDCEFIVTDKPDTFQKKVDCAWRPSTNAVEMVGGPADGEVWAVARVGDPLKYAVQRPVSFGREADDRPPTLADDQVVYSVAGWSEGSRRWVYRP